MFKRPPARHQSVNQPMIATAINDSRLGTSAVSFMTIPGLPWVQRADVNSDK
jgi:hypothetical protein